MSYYLDFEKMSLGQLKDIIINSDLVPSRRIIKEGIDETFKILTGEGINTAHDLKDKLKNKQKLADFSLKSGIDSYYLTILIREVNSLQPKPNRIRDFPSISIDVIESLEGSGIKNSKQIFEKFLKKGGQKLLIKESGLTFTMVQKLAMLSELSRIRWVNPTFAHILFELGYRSVKSVAEADLVKLHREVNDFNLREGFYKGKIGIHDIQLTIDFAKLLNSEAEA